jgi:hypothetical protein
MTSDNEPQRFRSSLPTQSLALLNSPTMMRVTKAFADQVMEQSRGDSAQAVRLAFEAAYSRQPRESELALAREAMAADGDPREGLRLFLQAMLGANDFLYSY